MNALIGRLKHEGAQQARVLAGPVLILLVLMMMVLPLAPLVLDLFFTFNISLAVMILPKRRVLVLSHCWLPPPYWHPVSRWLSFCAIALSGFH